VVNLALRLRFFAASRSGWICISGQTKDLTDLAFHKRFLWTGETVNLVSPSMTSAPIMPILLGGLIAWRVYRRIRRNIGRQELRPRRITLAIIIFTVLTVFLFTTSLQFPRLLFGIGGGLLLGGVLGKLGLRFTQFETSEEGHFYTPDTRIGVALSLLFIGRLLYRFWAIRNISASSHGPPPFRSPLTFFIYGLIAGYYLVYYIGLFMHTRGKNEVSAT
jgi:hypothetical protein